MTHDRANRIAWIGWAATLPLAYLGPVVRALTGVRGSGRRPIYAAVGVMIVVLLLVRRDRRAFLLSLSMSASAITIGATGGFVAVALLGHRLLAGLLALKWLLAAAVLTWLFRCQIHERLEPELPFDPEAFQVEAKLRHRLGLAPEDDLNAHLSTLSSEERREVSTFLGEAFQSGVSHLEESRRRSRRETLSLLRVGIVFFLLGIALLGLSKLTSQAKSPATQSRTPLR